MRTENISKEFPGVKALTDVNFKVESGKVLGLLGENGAGKSTLLNVISGVYQPTSGKVFVEGKEVVLHNTHQAHDLGINIVHQELKLMPELTVAENIFLGRYPKGKFGISYKKMYEQAREVIDRFGFGLDEKALVKDLPIASQQMVEIAKAVSFNGKVILLDEPTSSLTADEVDKLFAIMNNLKEHGVGVVFISHKLEEIFQFCDDVQVLRDGCDMGERPVKGVTEDELVRLMVGRDIENRFPKKTNTPGKVVLRAEHLTRGKHVKDVSFELREGEVLGIAGLVGAGRSELVRLVFGADRLESGSLEVFGEKVHIKSPGQAIEKGIYLVPEDRKKEGLVLGQDVEKNVALACTKRNTGAFGKVNRGNEIKAAEDAIKRYSIKVYSREQIVGTLSGGNQQKVVLGKCTATEPKIMILDDPTRGIDVGTKAEIYDMINQFTVDGMAVIMISSELPEVMAMSDRILVMGDGEMKAIIDRKDFDQETIMRYAIGGAES